MKRTNTLWTSLFLCFALLNLGLVGPSLARNKSATDPISGLSSNHMAPSALTRSKLTAVSNLWTKYSGNPVLDVGAPGSWDSNGVGTPSVLIRDANFLLWYAGNSGTTSSNRVGLATSPDGLTWNKSQNNPVLTVGATGTWDSGYVMAPHVIYHDGIYKMWYRGNSTNFAGENIGYATSTDGVTWVKYPGNPVLATGSTGTWESNNIMSAYVTAEGSIYKMWYSGCSSMNCRIGYATSPDGINWIKYAGNPVLDIGLPGSWDSMFVYYPNVLYNGSNYEMWYSAFNNSTIAIGYASSMNGVNWSKDSTNPILTPGTIGSWDSVYTIASPVIAHSGTYKMWYSGRDSSGSSRIGYATSAPVTRQTYLPMILR